MKYMVWLFKSLWYAIKDWTATFGAFRSNVLITLNKIIAAETSAGHGVWYNSWI